MRYKIPARVLAIDLHPRRFGFVVFESPKKLLDWGVRGHRHKGNSTEVLVRKRLRPLLELWQPSLLLVQSPSRMTPKVNAHSKLFCRIVMEAKSHRVPVRIGPKQAQGLTKHENARLVAEHFPVLARSLPLKRKPWESEDYRMSRFSAAALAEACLRPAGQRMKRNTAPR
jgi:hypothetical protein